MAITEELFVLICCCATSYLRSMGSHSTFVSHSRGGGRLLCSIESSAMLPLSQKGARLRSFCVAQRGKTTLRQRLACSIFLLYVCVPVQRGPLTIYAIRY